LFYTCNTIGRMCGSIRVILMVKKPKPILLFHASRLFFIVMMQKRKSISKKTRFEVFKRDSFTCQYCGAKAPDAILEIDHLNPVKHGGDNDLLNLITSCFVCNRGKSDRKLSDNSVVEKQRVQIEELNLRRQQLEMILEWRNELQKDRNFELNKIHDYWREKFKPYDLVNPEEWFASFVKKYNLIEILDCIDISYRQYFRGDKESATYALEMLGGILYNRSKN